MCAADGCHPGNQEPGLGIDAPETVDEREVIPHELVLEMRPVARVRVVDSQMDHDDVTGELHRLAELLLLEIRPMAMAQERRARLAEVSHLVLVPQHPLQLHRMEQLRSLGFHVYVVDGEEKINQVVAEEAREQAGKGTAEPGDGFARYAEGGTTEPSPLFRVKKEGEASEISTS